MRLPGQFSNWSIDISLNQAATTTLTAIAKLSMLRRDISNFFGSLNSSVH